LAWVVDTSVVLDVRLADPVFGRASSACLHDRLADGLVIPPVVFAEMAITFHGDSLQQEGWLTGMEIQFAEPWIHVDTRTSHRLWHDYILRKRGGAVPKRPLADVFVAAFALRFQGLITRNRADFASIAPTLNIVEP